ncbi:GNAT family protein [uncultured Photobacterium sp.]|uniref:GNAT family N-acetyltransferase n=1 Tax=uncultured Photobacterium sp. TaxID=173973 RepID=UPI002631849F|nr:GNAT family protein [uncultured Photobacterium sp.]
MQYQKLKQGLPCPLTDDLNIQLIQQDDFSDLVTMLKNPNVTQYLFFAPSPVEVYEAFFMPIIDNTREAIANNEWPESPTFIIRNHSGEFIGMVGLSPAMMLAGNFDVGYQIAEHAWRQGIASTACKFITTLAFEQLDAHKVSADCYAGNTGSIRVLEKSGFTIEGRQRDYYRLDNSFDDRLWFGMSKADFKKLSSKSIK